MPGTAILPDSWMRVRSEKSEHNHGLPGFPSQVLGRDGSCVVTVTGLALYATHLVPVKHKG